MPSEADIEHAVSHHRLPSTMSFELCVTILPGGGSSDNPIRLGKLHRENPATEGRKSTPREPCSPYAGNLFPSPAWYAARLGAASRHDLSEPSYIAGGAEKSPPVQMSFQPLRMVAAIIVLRLSPPSTLLTASTVLRELSSIQQLMRSHG